MATRALRRPLPAAPAKAEEREAPSALRDVRHTVGNCGLGTLLAQREAATRGRIAAQRLGTSSRAVGAHLGKSKAKGVAGMGVSSFAVVQQTLAEYEQQKRQVQVLPETARKAPEAQMATTLEKLDRLSTTWINTHPKDAERRAVLVRLVDQLAEERVALSKKQAQAVYLDNLAAGGVSRGMLSPFTGNDSQRFEAASGAARGNAYEAKTGFAPELRVGKMLALDGGAATAKTVKERLDFMAKYKITAAEGAAIRTYTEEAPEFRYMNAAAANDPGWLDAMRGPTAKSQVTANMLAKVNNKEVMEEGSLHTAMAVSGLAKLPPYPGDTYRGETVTEAELKAKTQIGKTVTFPNLTSTSSMKGKAADFVTGNLSDSRPIGLLWVFTNSGGRKLGMLSALEGEGEVILLPGTAVKIVSVRQTSKATDKFKVYEVHTLPMPTTKAPPKPKAPPAPPIPAGGLPPLSAPGAPPLPPGGLPPLPPPPPRP